MELLDNVKIQHAFNTKKSVVEKILSNYRKYSIEHHF